MRGKSLVAASVVAASVVPAALFASVFLALLPPLAAAETPPVAGEHLDARLERFRTEEAERREPSWYEPMLALDALWQAKVSISKTPSPSWSATATGTA
jgi:hypothetical protein